MIDIDNLKWVTYNGTQWTEEHLLVSHMSKSEADHYYDTRELIKGRELEVRGDDLVEYNVAHFAVHGESVKGFTHLIDREWVEYYIEQSAPHIDKLKWTLWSGVEFTLANRINTDRNHYNNHKKHVEGGVEITLSGEELSQYKAAHLAAHGETLRAPKLVLIDSERAMGYIAYLRGTEAYMNYLGNTPADFEEGVVVPDVMDLLLGTTTNKTVLEELLSITQSKGLHWVPYCGGIYLPMMEASLAKGVEKDDYSSNWQGKLPGIPVLLEGGPLNAFKDAYVKEYGTWPYKYVRSLRIGNWEHAYAYLVQGKSPTAHTFQSMGARSIQQTVEHTTNVPAPVVVPRCPETWTCEEGLVDRVFKLMELSTIKMQREACLFNTLGNTPTTRRVDAIQHLVGADGIPKVHVYEFKKGAITAAHVADAVATKGYVQLVRERYPDSKVCLYMVGTGVDPQAQRLLDCMRGVMFLPLTALLNIIVTDIMASWPKEGHYQLRTHFLSQYSDILPPEMLSGPVDMPLPTATYHKPIAPQIP